MFDNSICKGCRRIILTTNLNILVGVGLICVQCCSSVLDNIILVVLVEKSRF